MMSRWHSLFACGALLATVALLVPGTALAQVTVTNDTVRILEATPPAHDKLEVTWEFTGSAQAGMTAAGFTVYYGQVPFVAGETTGNAEGEMNVAQPTGTDGKATLTGLMPGKTYYAAVAVRTTATATGVTTVGATVISTNNSATPPVGESAMTEAAPVPDRVSGVMVEAGDKRLMAEWDAPFADVNSSSTTLTIAEYHVQYRTTQTADMAAGKWMPEKEDGMTVMMAEAEIPNLMNGTSYDVRVRAENSAGGMGQWSRVNSDSRGTPMAGAGTGDDGMTETPALPLVGLLALFGGLLAAARARLRR